MYTTKAEDLTRIANDLDLLARKYGDGAQHLDQQTAGLDGATQQLISGGPEHWLGVSSEAFQAAWEERRARLQQVSQILSQSAQHFTQFARTIEDNLPTIRADQAVMQAPASHMLGVDDQASLLNEESQAQNAILTALAALNSQLESLAEEVKDCPEEKEGNHYPGYGNEPYNKSNSNAGEEGDNKPVAGGSGDGASALDDLFNDPYALENMTPEEVKQLAQSEGWQVDTLGQGAHKGQGLVVREKDSNGNLTGKMIQWHPGGGHHGSEPYWKVSSPKTGTIRIGQQFPRSTT